MADDKPVTPEQQLLKLIEESNKTKGASASGAGKAAPKGPGGFSFSKIPGVLAGRMAFFKRNAAKKSPGGQKMSVDIAGMNRFFTVAAGCLLIYVVFDAAASARNLQRPPNFVPPKDLMTPFKAETIEPLKESSYYLQKVSARDIFREGKKAETAKQEPASQNLVVETAEAVKNLALVGISWSKDPDAIIEDKAHQRTFFVKRGQVVGDNVKVEAIFKDHVVVTFEDHEYELR